MKLFNAKNIKAIDKYCIEVLGIPSLVLMESAAMSIINNIDLDKNNKFTVVCGTGNNGADGLAVAKHLIARNKKVNVFIVGNIEKGTLEFHSNKKILEKFGVEIKSIGDKTGIDVLTESLKLSDIVIDSVFGIGMNRTIKGIYFDVIDCINANSQYVIGVDIPSGISSDTGKIMGISVLCNKTVTFTCYKQCMIYEKINKSFGEIILANIGVPDFVLDMFHEKFYLSDVHTVTYAIPNRGIDGHKGNFGKIVIVAGSKGFTGAAYISTQAAVKSGSGLVTLCTDSYTQNIVSNKVIEAMSCDYFNDKARYIDLLKSSDCIAIGPGLGSNDNTLSLLFDVIKNHDKNIVIDADGLNVLSNNLKLLFMTNAKVIITPHPGEMARLTGKTIDYINKNRVKVAMDFAKNNNVIVLLKGYNTIITDGEEVYINPTGCSAMASGGMGDCLTGMIASLIGQGIDVFRAGVVGAYLHGYIAEVLAKEKYSVQATELIDNIAFTMNKFCLKHKIM